MNSGISEQAWNWYNERVGKTPRRQRAIVDTFRSVFLFHYQLYKCWHLMVCVFVDVPLGKRRRDPSSSLPTLVRLKRNQVRQLYHSSVLNLLLDSVIGKVSYYYLKLTSLTLAEIDRKQCRGSSCSQEALAVHCSYDLPRS